MTPWLCLTPLETRKVVCHACPYCLADISPPTKSKGKDSFLSACKVTQSKASYVTTSHLSLDCSGFFFVCFLFFFFFINIEDAIGLCFFRQPKPSLKYDGQTIFKEQTKCLILFLGFWGFF